MLDELRLARAVKRQRRQVADKAELAELGRRRLAHARRQFVSAVTRELSRPLSLAAFFTAGFLLGPPRIGASPQRLSIGTLAALLMTAQRAVEAFHHLSRGVRARAPEGRPSVAPTLERARADPSLLEPRS